MTESGDPRQRHVLLTGRPGVGKTTVIRRLADRLTAADGGASENGTGVGEGLDAAPPPLRIAGFLTEEIRDEGERQGFRAVSLPDGRGRTMAHREMEGGPRVDEIGKMECLSDRFVEAVRALLDGPRPVVATVGAGGPDFMETVRRREDAELWRVTRDNRDALPGRLDRRARKLVGAPGG